MVSLGRHTALAHHRGPARRALLVVVTTAVVVCLTGAGLLIRAYGESPPWAADIAYESGYLLGKRVHQYDPGGRRVRELLDGGCARMEAEGLGGRNAAHDPVMWVSGCLDGAAGRPSRHQGLAY
ncbi:hypothetical protein [Streptomyces sp. NPDC050856]|uniref:hypothetical protein n=1 Tax=Streptomyces sp. NPDC050856 TaxID=3154939 RepID=UPI0033FFC491